MQGWSGGGGAAAGHGAYNDGGAARQLACLLRLGHDLGGAAQGHQALVVRPPAQALRHRVRGILKAAGDAFGAGRKLCARVGGVAGWTRAQGCVSVREES
jgi:hypothetical protein